MKKKLFSLLVTLTAVMQPSVAATNNTDAVLLDTYYNHEVKNGKLQHYTWDDTSWGGFSLFGNMIKCKGYGLATLDAEPTAETLAQYKSYVIVDPDHEKDNKKPNYMTEATAKVIAQWVKKGGKLVVFANDSQNCDIEHINILTSMFGMNLNGNSILNLAIPEKAGEVISEPLQGTIPGAEKFYLRGTCSIECKGKNVKPLVWTDKKETVIAQAKYGKGSVIVVGDPWIYNEYIDHVLVNNSVDNGAGARFLVDFLCPEAKQESGWTKDEVKTLITQVNAAWQKRNPAETRSFWDPAAYHTGNIEAYKITGNSKQLAYSTRWAEYNDWKGAKEANPAKWKYKNYGEGMDYVLFGDWQICFQTYIDLYNIAKSKGCNAKGCGLNEVTGIAPVETWVARAKEVMGYEARSAANDYWWWADALYMVMPVMTKMYKLTGEEIYLDKLYQNLCYSDSIMLDKETGLYFRDGKYIYPKHKSANGKKDFWARGDGWVLAGLAKVLQDMPETYKHRQFFVDKYVRLAKAVASVQQQQGYWTRSMMDPEHAPGPETSGTAFFTYGMLWGVNNGFLAKEEFMPTINRAWDYLTTMALQPDGLVGYVQPIGEKAIPGQTVDAHSQANFGVGAFLLAASEYYRLLSK